MKINLEMLLNLNNKIFYFYEFYFLYIIKSLPNHGENLWTKLCYFVESTKTVAWSDIFIKYVW